MGEDFYDTNKAVTVIFLLLLLISRNPYKDNAVIDVLIIDDSVINREAVKLRIWLDLLKQKVRKEQ